MEGLEGLIFVILIFWVLPALLKGKKGGKKQQNAQQSAQATRPAAQRQTPSVQMHRPAPAAANHTHRDFSAPASPTARKNDYFSAGRRGRRPLQNTFSPFLQRS